MSVMPALWYLQLTMQRNKLIAFVRQLSKPAPLFGLLFMLGFLAFFAFSRSTPRRPPPAAAMDGFEFIFSMGATIMLMVAWAFPKQSPGLKFTEAEVAFLFPAPIRRLQLLHYKLLLGLGMGLASALMPTLVLTLPNPAAGFGSFCKTLLLASSLMTLFFYHGMAATLCQFRLAEWYGSKARPVVVALLLLLIAGAIGLVFAGEFGILRRFMPGRLLVHAAFASDDTYVLWQLLLLGIVALHYVWVLRLDTPFEESAIAIATHWAQLRAGKSLRVMQLTKGRQDSFRLAATMPAELVMLWNHLMQLPPYLGRKAFVIATLAVIGVMLLLPPMGPVGVVVASTVAKAAAASLPLLVAFVPLVAASLMSQHLANADLLKAWPLRGWRIVVGSLLSPLIVVTAVALLLVLTIALSADGPGQFIRQLSPGYKPVLVVATLLLVPAIAALELALGYLPALYFPGKLSIRGDQQRGLAAVGLSMAAMAGVSLLQLVALLPPLLLTALVFYLGRWFAAPVLTAALATLVSTTVLLVEVLFVVHVLGERFEQLDISAEAGQ